MSETTTQPAAPGSETTEATQRDLEYHGKAHGATGRDKVLHPLLGGLHTGSGSGSGGASDLPVLGDVIVAQGDPAAWQRYALVVPAANIRNALAVDNGETVPTWQETLDATAPTNITENHTAAPGTSLIYSHRDHEHGSPETWKATAHNLLDADRHPDTVAQSVTQGSMVYGNSTPKWDELVVGSAGQILAVVAGIPKWVTPASYSANGGALTSTTNTTGLMAGLAATLTPTFSGRLLLTAYGHAHNSGAVDGFSMGIRTGTGTAPTAGAALTGTVRGNVQVGVGGAANFTVPFSLSVVVTGFTVGTAIWIDLTKASLAGGTLTVDSTYLSVLEF